VRIDTAEVLVTNLLDVTIVRAENGLFRAEVRYADGPHKGELIIRTRPKHEAELGASMEFDEIMKRSHEAIRVHRVAASVTTEIYRITPPKDDAEYARALIALERELKNAAD
jgi:hypothetical protein